MSRALAWVAILACAMGLLFLSVRGINWKTVSATIGGIQAGYVLLAVTLGTLPMFARAARWRVLLQAEAPVAFWTSFWAVCAGYFGNNFLPARAGEVLRSYLVRRQSTLSMGYVVATAISERVADAVALVLLGAVTVLLTPGLPSWMEKARWPCMLVGVAGVVFLICLPYSEGPLRTFLRRTPRLRELMQQCLLGIRSFHDLKRMLLFASFTLVIWVLDVIATATLAHSMAIPMSLVLALLLIVALSLSSALPSTPGYLGVYQLVAVTVLRPFGISASAALAFILVMQALTYLQTGVLGLIGLHECSLSLPAYLRLPRPIQTQS